MAIHPNEINFYREQQRIIADNRARAQQKIHDFETFRQRQREQKFWDERTAYVKRVTTAPKVSKPEPPILVPGRAPVFVPDESQQDAGGKEPARCFSSRTGASVISTYGCRSRDGWLMSISKRESI
jgi:hypothetical protein